jgi:hypothetical protein
MTTDPRLSGHFARDVAEALMHELTNVFAQAAKAKRSNPVLQSLSNPRDVARFWSKVGKGRPDQCWHWRGNTNASGYGIFTVRGRQVPAHRYGYMLAHGALDPELYVLHACDEPGCVNGSHLRAGTAADNARDRIARKRVKRGEHHPAAKLTEAEVRAIRSSKQSANSIARKKGLSATTICRIRRGVAWTHV